MDQRPFRINVPDEVLVDLRRRLADTRWPDAETVDDWSQGAPLAWIQDICRYWADGYDWRAREARLNRFDQFITTIDGLDIHFVHQRSPHPAAQPLVITHGWPGSIVEFHKVIEPLTNPTEHGGNADDAFHVICPALPGFGFSGKPTTTGWGVERIADAWAALMAGLGYDRYFAQGGDWGSAVTRALGAQDVEHCAAIHITLAMGTRPRIEGDPTPEEQRALEGGEYYRAWDSGYSKQQSTRPQTVGYGLADSPAGTGGVDPREVLGVDRLRRPPGEHPQPRRAVGQRDVLLGDQQRGELGTALLGELRQTARATRLSVPVGVAVYPKEIVPPVRRWMEADYPNIVHWSEQPKGGHFAAFEQPELFVDDIRTCFRQFR